MTNKEVNDTFAHAYIWMVKHNTGNSNPYHNDKHILFVFQMAMQIFAKYKKEYNLKSKDQLILGLAAIFHDMNHSGGELPDNENIKLSINGFEQYVNEFPEYDEYKNDVIELIKSTEFPHKKDDINILQMILRDADTTVPDNVTYLVNALSSEYKKDLMEFIPQEIGYIDTIKYNLPYSNEYHDRRKDELKKNLLKLQSDLFFK